MLELSCVDGLDYNTHPPTHPASQPASHTHPKNPITSETIKPYRSVRSLSSTMTFPLSADCFFRVRTTIPIFAVLFEGSDYYFRAQTTGTVNETLSETLVGNLNRALNGSLNGTLNETICLPWPRTFWPWPTIFWAWPTPKA